MILVDFSDNPASSGLVFGQKADFENLLFSHSEFDNTYSMAELYLDNSYGSVATYLGAYAIVARVRGRYAAVLNSRRPLREEIRPRERESGDYLVTRAAGKAMHKGCAVVALADRE